MGDETEQQQKRATILKQLNLDELTKVVRLSFGSKYEDFGKLSLQEQKEYYIDLEVNNRICTTLFQYAIYHFIFN